MNNSYIDISLVDNALNAIEILNRFDLPGNIRKILFSLTARLTRIKNFPIDNEEHNKNIATIQDRANQIEMFLNSNRSLGDIQVKALFNLLSCLRNIVGESNVTDIAIKLFQVEARIDVFRNEQKIVTDRISSNKKRLSDIEIQIENLESIVHSPIEQAKEKAQDILNDLIRQQNDVEKLVGIISGNSISGNYQSSADREMAAANSTRNGSLLLMLTILVILSISLFDIGSLQFDWKASLMRLLYSLALSVPAAYLARESTKHRKKEHEYKQMSLELQAITPYLSSLPDEMQHKLKSELASKIFCTQSSSQPLEESYPINLQEIIMAIVSKFDTKNAAPKKE